MKQQCFVCGKEEDKPQACSICYTATYCSRECQKRDYKTHKSWCRPWLKYHPVVSKFVACELGKMPECLGIWIDHSKEFLKGTNTPSGPQNLQTVSQDDHLDLNPTESYVLVFEPWDNIETLGDMMGVMFPDGIVPCDTILFSQLMLYKLTTPLVEFRICLNGMPSSSNVYATPQHPILGPLLLEYFHGMGMIAMHRYGQDKFAAMLPDGPINGTLDAVTSAMTSLYLTLNSSHPDAGKIVPGGTFSGFPEDTPAGDILKHVMSKLEGIHWEIFQSRGG